MNDEWINTYIFEDNDIQCFILINNTYTDKHITLIWVGSFSGWGQGKNFCHA